MPDWTHLVQRQLDPLRLDPAREREVRDELTQHLEDRYQELRSGGMDDRAAMQDARRQLKQLARQLADVEPWSPPEPARRTLLGSLWQDLRYTVRGFRKAPGFVAVVLVTLALGIGATTAVFSVLDLVLLRPFPYPDIHRIVSISQRTTDGRFMSVAWPDFLDWRAQNRSFEALGIWRGATVNLTGGDQPARLNGAVVSSGVFAAMGIGPLYGRVFRDAEDQPGAERLAIVSERLWRGQFNGDAGLIGRSIVLNGEAHTVIGVMPAGMRYPSRLTDVWLPIGPLVRSFPPRGAHPGLNAIGRLKPGVTFDEASADLDTIATRLAEQYPESNKITRAAPALYFEQVVQNIRPTLLMLIAAVGFVLLIACANLANLLLSRAERRHREIAVRAALGANRRRIVQQLLVESVTLSLLGGALGSLLAWWAVKAFVASQPTTVPRIDLLTVDGRVLAFTAGISIVTGVLFGLVPALRASRPDLLSTLKDAGRGASAASHRFRSVVIVAEVALAMMLLVGAGLMIRSVGRLMAIDPGFDPARVVTVRLTVPEAKYPDRDRWTAFHRELVRRVGTVPGIESAGLNSAVPLEGGGSEAQVIKEGDPIPTADRPATTTLFQTTSPGYFRTMGMPILRGRAFTDRDVSASTPVAIVDETLVSKLFPHVDPIGQRVSFETRGHGPSDREVLWREIVGVVRHVRHYGLAQEPPFVQIYTPYEQLPVYYETRRPAMALLVRSSLSPEATAAAIRRELAGIDRDIPLFGLQTMGRYVAQNMEERRLTTILLSAFGALALLLAIVGVYGVLSYSVARQVREMGIRLALGATRRTVLVSVLLHGLRLTAIGIVLGLAGAYAGTHVLGALLFEVSPRDPGTFAGLAALLGAVALAACLLPAIRATRVNPIDALREG